MGSYYLIEEGASLPDLKNGLIHYMCDQVAMCFDADSGTMFKHGSYADVNAWHKKTKDRSPWELVVLLFPVGHPVESINRCLLDSGFAQRLYRELVAQPPSVTAGSDSIPAPHMIPFYEETEE